MNNSLLSAQAIGANLNAVVQDALAFATCENVKEEPALQVRPYFSLSRQPTQGSQLT